MGPGAAVMRRAAARGAGVKYVALSPMLCGGRWPLMTRRMARPILGLRKQRRSLMAAISEVEWAIYQRGQGQDAEEAAFGGKKVAGGIDM